MRQPGGNSQVAGHVDVLFEPPRGVSGFVLPDFAEWNAFELADDGIPPSGLCAQESLSAKEAFSYGARAAFSLLDATGGPSDWTCSFDPGHPSSVGRVPAN